MYIYILNIYIYILFTYSIICKTIPGINHWCSKTAQVIILLVLLTWWQDFPKDEDPYQVLEFFAGVGRIAALAKFASFKSGAVDIEYGKGRRKRSRPPMDMNSNAGLLFLGKTWISCL